MRDNNKRQTVVKLCALAFFLVTQSFMSFILRFRSAIAATPEFILMSRKRLTPRIVSTQHSRPEYFATRNNLYRKTGSPFIATGEYLFLEGYITDVADVPLEDVKIKIWHANHFGYYNHLFDRDDIDRHDIDFSGSGISITNNVGYYCFYTIMPGFYANRAPHIHFYLEHRLFDSLETEMFFPRHPRNLVDQKYQSLTPQLKPLVTCIISNIDDTMPDYGKKALFNIKLDVIHPHKRY